MAFSLSDATKSCSQSGRYSFTEILGVGSFGTVLLAKDSQQNGENVAIKVVKANKSILEYLRKKRKEALVNAQQEVDILLQLKHENVVSLIDFFEFSKGGLMNRVQGLAMVMEYCGRGNLQEYLSTMASKDQYLNMSQRKLWYTQLSNALQFIHSKGIIHRDLKPPNILLDDDLTLKVADVGLAKTVWEVKSHCKELSSDTTFNQYMSSLTGTPVYMAPEVWDERYNVASDVFSLGLIFLMIAEVPNPPIPYAYWLQDTHCLGKIMDSDPVCRQVTPATKLLSLAPRHSTEQEFDLFNSMLQYDYHDRPSMIEVIRIIDELGKDKIEDSRKTQREQGKNCIIL